MFRKFLITVVTVFFSIGASAADSYFYGDSNSTWLGSDGWCGFDWIRPAALAASKSTLENGGQIKLQTRFQWQGSGAIPYIPNKTGEHAFIAFTQNSHIGLASGCPYGGSPNFLNASRHSPRQWLHQYGIGALISPVGLLLEAWNGDFTASKWSQEDDRCDISIPSGAKGGACLSDSPYSSESYITSNPGFQLVRGQYYWLRLTLTGNQYGNPYVTVKAELVEQTPWGSATLQGAQMGLLRDKFFPYSGVIESTIGRTSFEFGTAPYSTENILFWAFNYGF